MSAPTASSAPPAPDLASVLERTSRHKAAAIAHAHGPHASGASGLNAAAALSARDGSGLGPAEALTLTPPTPTTSAGAAFTRSLLLFLGFMFRRPSKLFRPNRLDTWAGLRQLAESADQNLSPAFVRSILKLKGGPAVLAASLIPPLVVNTTLGFLLFSSHSIFSLWLARLPYFERVPDSDHDPATHDKFDILGLLDGDYGDLPDGYEHIPEEEITLETIIRGPRAIPRHPTLLSAIAGAGAGVLQGMAFTPIENVVRFIQQSASSVTAMTFRFLHLPLPKTAAALGPPAKSVREAFDTLLARSSWHKSNSWWSGWRWAIGRDALSYSIFFATFDVTRRVGLHVKATTTRSELEKWGEADDLPDNPDVTHRVLAATAPSETPTRARLAQAGTIVLGGIMAASAAEIAGRPFRTFQRVSTLAASERQRLKEMGEKIPDRYQHPIKTLYQKGGFGAFMHRDGIPKPLTSPLVRSWKATVKHAVSKTAWRVAAVGPWGFGFLVFAWIGGEV